VAQQATAESGCFRVPVRSRNQGGQPASAKASGLSNATKSAPPLAGNGLHLDRPVGQGLLMQMKIVKQLWPAIGKPLQP
jgi:hypothetical protein